MALNKTRWEQIKKGMLGEGWRSVVEIHTDVLKPDRDRIKSKLYEKYPTQRFEHRWYHNHMAYNCLFVRLKGIDAEVIKPEVDKKAENEKKHLEHDFYRQSHNYREEVRKQQILKGAEKYPEPFTPDSWSDRELIDHTMMENVDQGHYIVGLGKRIGALRSTVDKMHSFHKGLKIHLQCGYDNVKKDLDVFSPIRNNYERSIMMIDALIEEGERIGRNENK